MGLVCVCVWGGVVVGAGWVGGGGGEGRLLH